jgi:hypothetical protein
VIAHCEGTVITDLCFANKQNCTTVNTCMFPSSNQNLDNNFPFGFSKLFDHTVQRNANRTRSTASEPRVDQLTGHKNYIKLRCFIFWGGLLEHSGALCCSTVSTVLNPGLNAKVYRTVCRYAQ